ncbi:MAG: sigma-70 family RNA polymerase sigma factor [Bryobacteraceae bacterium]
MLELFFLAPFLGAQVADQPDLLDRLAHGDATALSDAYNSYGVLVYRVILRMVSDPGVAEELTQDTFLRLWNRAGLLLPGSSLGPWIVTIARNRAIDYLRSTGGRIASHQSQLETLEHGHLFAGGRDTSIDSSQKREIKQAIEKLSRHQREAIDLAYYEGLSHTEIAQRMNQPLGTVKSWIRAALRTLRAELEETKEV